MLKHFFKLSFKTQLVLFVSLGIIVTGATAFLYVLNSQISSFESIYFDSINTSTKTVKLGLELGLSKENFDAINQVFDWVKQDKKFVCIILKDETNETIATFPPSFEKSTKELDNLIKSNSINNKTYYVKEHWDAKYLKGTFVVGFSTNQFYEQKKKSFKEILLVELVLLVLGFVITLYMSSKITLPLVRLQKFAEKIDTGDLSSRADEVKGNKETNLVAKSVNSMVDRLLQIQSERVEEVTKFNESLGSQNQLLINY
ncbi:MAG: HAMP domain-containing protein [Candidatus Kapabacteria bacterium]|nr:HAMP domain-containing protein [Candidatus Kapabacteria bacterium]